MQALTNEAITIFGEGKQTRSFCYYQDMIEAIVRIMNNTSEDFVGPVNIGNPSEFSIRQLAEKVIEMTGSASKMVFRDLPSDDPIQRRPDIALARSTLDWEPRIQIEEGLGKTIAYFEQVLKEGREES